LFILVLFSSEERAKVNLVKLQPSYYYLSGSTYDVSLFL